MKLKKDHFSPKRWAHGMASKWLVLIASFFSILKVTGLENIPKSGGAVVVANHLSYFDAVALAAALDRSGRDAMVLAKSELFRKKFQAQTFRALGVIPVYRGTERAGDSLAEAVKSLRGGELVTVFPEGTIPEDGALLEFKTGAVRMALEAQVPIIPVALVGTDHIISSNLTKVKRTLFKRGLKQRPVYVSIGKPITLTGNAEDKETVRAANAQVRSAVISELWIVDPERGERARAVSNKKLSTGFAVIPVVGGLTHLAVSFFRKRK